MAKRIQTTQNANILLTPANETFGAIVERYENQSDIEKTLLAQISGYAAEFARVAIESQLPCEKIVTFNRSEKKDFGKHFREDFYYDTISYWKIWEGVDLSGRSMDNARLKTEHRTYSLGCGELSGVRTTTDDFTGDKIPDPKSVDYTQKLSVVKKSIGILPLGNLVLMGSVTDYTNHRIDYSSNNHGQVTIIKDPIEPGDLFITPVSIEPSRLLEKARLQLEKRMKYYLELPPEKQSPQVSRPQIGLTNDPFITVYEGPIQKKPTFVGKNREFFI